MKTIPLTQGKFAIVDDEDFEYLNQFKWCAHKAHNTFYAERYIYSIGNNKGKLKSMHREIMNTPHGMSTDHIDGNGLNNSRKNLRICTPSQNSRNRGGDKNNATSQYKGVIFDKRRGKWAAHIGIGGGKCKGSKNFDSEIDAAKAYNELAIKYHGEFAKLNII